MNGDGTASGQGRSPDLAVSSEDLTRLAHDLDAMQSHLDRQVRRMDTLVDRVEAGWQGPAATAYRAFHRAAAEDAVRIREVMRQLEEAVRLSRDGFSADEWEVVRRMRAIQVDIGGEVDKLSTPHTEPAPRSNLDSF
ncbi:WXG100 family type VII secretion target [Streptomyces sp. NPDC048290]|uniref:WXG100 family type VII secretion target n=1 Tax=Streptomyces sp. NPDC048290 TaxID=3155811 RepID=UPI003439F8E2